MVIKIGFFYFCNFFLFDLIIIDIIKSLTRFYIYFISFSLFLAFIHLIKNIDKQNIVYIY